MRHLPKALSRRSTVRAQQIPCGDGLGVGIEVSGTVDGFPLDPLVAVAGGDAIGVGPFVSRDADAITRPNREC